jgi:hypothetical protein
MSRPRHAVILVLALAVSGCGGAPRPATNATAGAAPPSQTIIAMTQNTPLPVPATVAMPAPFMGTWRTTEGGFLAIGADRVAVACPGLPQRTCRITACDELNPGSVVVSGDHGLRLTLARGQDTRTRRVGALELAADCPLLDAGIAFAEGGSTTLRLWGDAPLTWLPLMTTPTPAPAARPASISDPVADQAFVSAAMAFDAVLGESAQDLCQAASAGAPAEALDQLAAAVTRQRQLAALSALEAAVNDPTALAMADRHTAGAAGFADAYRAWSRRRG